MTLVASDQCEWSPRAFLYILYSVHLYCTVTSASGHQGLLPHIPPLIGDTMITVMISLNTPLTACLAQNTVLGDK